MGKRTRYQPDLDHLAARTAEIQAQLELDAACPLPLIGRPSAHDRRSKHLKRKITVNRLKGFRMLHRGHSVDSISQLGDFTS
jgi:hypothetical protein